jgi:glycosyltransferase involved in cell wall biosynthesis
MKKQTSNLISIVLPVYNAGSFLREALDSVLNQTYKDWELICIDDGSTDYSLNILQEYSLVDSRIKVYKNKKNQGVSATTNFAISKCHGQYLARMDADDVMTSDRLEKQVKFLKRNPKVIVLGGQCQLINGKGEKIGQKMFPLTHKEIYKMMYEAMPIQQPTMMVNLKLLPLGFSWYENTTNTAEEVDLLFRLFEYGEFANLPDYLLNYRLHGQNLSLKNPKMTFKITYQTRKMAIKKYGYNPTLKARIANLVQYLIVSLLPGKAIFPLFGLWRGLIPVQSLMPKISLPQIRLAFWENLARSFVSLFI